MRATLVVLAIVACTAGSAHGQLVSPGPLSAPHAKLEGIRQCTACHQLGQRGADPQRCLECHDALAARLGATSGYHATVRNRPCGSCHAEHYGRDFVLVRLDTATFDHAATGYPLRSAHARVSCRDCHRATNVRAAAVRKEKTTAAALQRTFLGLATTCGSCHAADNPHAKQFGARDCGVCHTETRWTEATAFDHARAAFRLTGKHRSLECAACHPVRQRVAQYKAIAHEKCTTCHSDPHRGAQGAACESCHTTDGWRAFGSSFDAARFDHSRTRFPLRAAHARISCAACHRAPARSDARVHITLARSAEPTRFPLPIVRDCRSCHVQAHPGSEADGGAGSNCAVCHSEEAWSPASFGIREHARTRFALNGAHVLLACTRCHAAPAPGRLEFRRPDISCAACHTAANPHGRAYADAQGRTNCAQCHVTLSWKPSATRHESFPLTGGHAKVACASCHKPDRSRTPRQCDACHGATDPHRGQSAGRTCDQCHDTASFLSASRFDHSTTRYVLEGAHRQVACRACHTREQVAPGAVILRYKPLPIRCEECHGAASR